MSEQEWNWYRMAQVRAMEEYNRIVTLLMGLLLEDEEEGREEEGEEEEGEGEEAA